MRCEFVSYITSTFNLQNNQNLNLKNMSDFNRIDFLREVDREPDLVAGIYSLLSPFTGKSLISKYLYDHVFRTVWQVEENREEIIQQIGSLPSADASKWDLQIYKIQKIISKKLKCEHVKTLAFLVTGGLVLLISKKAFDEIVQFFFRAIVPKASEMVHRYGSIVIVNAYDFTSAKIEILTRIATSRPIFGNLYSLMKVHVLRQIPFLGTLILPFEFKILPGTRTGYFLFTIFASKILPPLHRIFYGPEYKTLKSIDSEEGKRAYRIWMQTLS